MSAGGGKSFALLLEPLRHVSNSGFGCVIFRQTYSQVIETGSLWDTSSEIYPHVGAIGKKGNLEWVFPSGANVSFGHLGSERDKYKYLGSQLCLLCFDELTHFSESAFFYMMSRNRSTCGVRPYIRATTNPDADSWIAKFIEWYIGEDGCVSAEKSGVIRWFVRKNGEMVWGDSKEEILEQYPGSLPKSFTFIRADIYDNQVLMQADPGYLGNLEALHPVDAQRLLYGSWTAVYSSSKVFSRDWFEIVDEADILRRSYQYGYEEVRFWDMAATEASVGGTDPSATSGTRMRKVEGDDCWYIMDSINRMVSPGVVNDLIKNTASQDGNLCKVRWEVEPGSASLRNSYDMIGMLIGYNALGMTPEANKIMRAKPLATSAYHGKVKLVRGAWNDRWLKSATNFPDDKKGQSKNTSGVKNEERPGNDDIDSAAGAFAALTRNTGVYKESRANWSR